MTDTKTLPATSTPEPLSPDDERLRDELIEVLRLGELLPHRVSDPPPDLSPIWRSRPRASRVSGENPEEPGQGEQA